jgi:hypothetical protein
MSVMAEVFQGLNAMSFLQLLSAFIACIGYGLVQGGMLGSRGRGIASTALVLGIVGFSVQGSDWVHSVMLGAFAIAGFGVFTATVWLTCRVIGIDRVASESPAMRTAADTPPAKSGARPGLSSPVASV